MIGNTIAISGTSTVTLVKEDGYSAEYRVRSGALNKTLNIRHSVESKMVNGEKMDRHYVGLKFSYFPGTDNGIAYPARDYEAYIVLRSPSADDTAKVKTVFTELIYALSTANTDGIIDEVLTWQS